MKFFLISAALIVLLYMRLEASFLKKSTINMSQSSQGLKVVHLSDIHIDKFYIPGKRLIAALHKIKPDLIIITGDYIEKQQNIPKFIKLLKTITEVYPVYLSLGNHDHRALKHNKNEIDRFVVLMEEAGATVLFNSNTSVSKNNTTYNLIGIDDLKQGNPDIEKAFKGIKTPSDSHCINIAFSHNPDTVLYLPKDKVDYFLCGHFHGGQIWLPFHLEFRILRREKLCKMGCRRGLHKVNGINIYINRGLGNVIFPFRFCSIPEIAVIHLP